MLTDIGTQFSDKVPPVAMESVEAEQKLGNSLDLQPVVLHAPLLCISLLAHTLPPSALPHWHYKPLLKQDPLHL
jgi:hypothetical protein